MKTIVRSPEGYVNVDKTVDNTVMVMKGQTGFISFQSIAAAINNQLNNPVEYVTVKMVRQSLVKLLSK